MELIVALAIIGIGIALAAAMMLNAPQQAEAHLAAEAWLRDTEQKHGGGQRQGGKPPATVPMPQEHLTPLREVLDGLYLELQQAQEALAKAQTQGNAAQPSGPAAPLPAPAGELRG